MPKKNTIYSTARIRLAQKAKVNDPIADQRYIPDIPNVQIPIVGIGASAGESKALKELFDSLPDNTGISFVVVAHQDPEHETLSRGFLQNSSAMTISQIETGMLAEPNRVYLIPPNKSVTISGGVLQLAERHNSNSHNQVIDEFLTSLACDSTSSAVGLILSGTGSDGTQGVKAIKTHFGMAIVQDEATAAYGGMPNTAYITGLADLVLAPDEMAQALIRYFRRQKDTFTYDIGHDQNQLSFEFNELLKQIFAHAELDFSRYKKNTLIRRVERRMNLSKIHLLSDYIALLKETPEEVEVLCKDMLIGVTGFFRDPDAYQFLNAQTFPILVADKLTDYQLRIWIPACGTGEEAYSIAITLYECLLAHSSHIQFKIYATDINVEAINTARKGIYTAAKVGDIDSTLLTRYLAETEDGLFQIKKIIREMVVFSSHNIITDPPFTKMDMIVCRNLMIYFESKLQQELIPIFHYSLKDDGILFLGSSEGIGQRTDLFKCESNKWKIFKSRPHSGDARSVSNYSAKQVSKRNVDKAGSGPDTSDEYSEIQLLKALLRNIKLSPCVIINLECKVLYIYGQTEKFLRVAQGKAKNHHLLKIVQPHLRLGMAYIVRDAIESRQISFHRDIKIEDKGKNDHVRVTVKPLLEHATDSELMIVVFEEVSSQPQSLDISIEHRQAALISSPMDQFDQDLITTQRYPNETAVKQDWSNGEMELLCEEMQSMNEELQGTVEELETSKEELQTANEESIIVNADLQMRVESLAVSKSDLRNLLDSTDMTVVFLDTDLQIQRVSLRITDIFSFSKSELGQPLESLGSTLIGINLNDIGEEVLNSFATLELDVETKDDRVYRLRAMPYRSEASIIEGIVLTFSDITSLARAILALSKSKATYRGILESASDSIAITDPETYTFIDFNKRAHNHLGYTREEFLGMNVADVEAQESQEESIAHIKKMAQGRLLSYDSRLKAKNGEIQAVHIEAKVLHRDNRPLIVTTWFDLQQQPG